MTVAQQIDGNPQFWIALCDASDSRVIGRGRSKFLFFVELGDAMRETRDFALRCVAMHDIFLRCTNERRLGIGHGSKRRVAITGSNRLFHLANSGTDLRTARFVDDGTAHGLACGLLGRFGIGHRWLSTILNESAAYKAMSRTRQRCLGVRLLSGDAFGANRVISGYHRRPVGGQEL